ncbi:MULTISPECIES: tetratricopeptide repeat protein [Lysinibacillus]|uniref:tetratricopeptide repeat protein n=1 Tax=Lysinibacillus TaxID=400634 RepID=UPI001C8B0D4C|nr:MULTISPECIES: tetratricopeptide repeat protein [Lysinibacillus]MBX8944740.1 tetratricopeptide repeat protein [Lysinibacillus sp. K60]WDU78745.1 tetratricopeptide repeat protein [Lysinibacillus sp. G01H]WHP41417.1 tetratricopeptide repeat protein [Lysinibacillus boronitolerans]
MEKKRQNETQSNIVSFIPTGDYYYKKSIQAMNSGQMNKAYKYLQRAVDLSPDDPMIILQLAIVELEGQRFEEAYDLLRRAYQIDPDNPEIIFYMAEVSGCVGIMHDAKRFAEEYLKLEPEGAYADEAAEILEFVAFEQDDFEELEGSGEDLYRQEQARRCMEKGDFPEAITILEDLIEDRPAFWSAYNNLALAYFYVGEEEQAKALLHTVLRENKGNLHALCNLTVIAYYEKNEEDLQELLNVLIKIQPYTWEHRYKLGATLALIGQYELAYKWLRSMQKRGYVGDAGFYFWLSHAAYFSGHEEISKSAWDQLLELDPDKEGFEPWRQQENEYGLDALEHDRDFIVEKLESTYTSERIFGLFLLKGTAHKQEIIAHPKWINIEQFGSFEKLFLAYALGHEFDKKNKVEASFLRSVQVSEILLEQYGKLSSLIVPMFQMWFVLCEQALIENYRFTNPTAIAGANDYLFRSSQMLKVTKKEIAQQYGVSVSTLSKYIDEILTFLPNSHD